MKLSQGILRPGKVLEVLENGNIKASAPGLFSAEDQSNLPPIFPFTSWHANSYSAPEVGDEVWILNLMDNPLQLYWFRKDKYEQNSIIKEENVEVICNRETPMSWATIYFSDGSGWVIKNDDSIININSDGDIVLSRPESHRNISIKSSGIELGGDSHPAVYGDELIKILYKIQIALSAVQVAASSNIITMPIGAAINSCANDLAVMIPKIVSPHVRLD